MKNIVETIKSLPRMINFIPATEEQIKNAEHNNEGDAEQISIFGIAEAALLFHLGSLLTVDFFLARKQRGGIAVATPPRC